MWSRYLRVLVLVVASGCVTPSVPVPPPEPELMSFIVDDTAHTVEFSYDPAPSYSLATVYVFNRSRGEGVITTAGVDGSVATNPFPGSTGEEIVVSFELDGDLASTCVRVANGRSSSALEC